MFPSYFRQDKVLIINTLTIIVRSFNLSEIIIFSVYIEFYMIEFLIILHRNPGESV